MLSSADIRRSQPNSGSRFVAQRAAYFAAPEPDHAERLADLKTLSRMISENQSAIVAAINADFGNRSEFETLFAEVFPAQAAIHDAHAPIAKLDEAAPPPASIA